MDENHSVELPLDENIRSRSGLFGFGPELPEPTAPLPVVS